MQYEKAAYHLRTAKCFGRVEWPSIYLLNLQLLSPQLESWELNNNDFNFK